MQCLVGGVGVSWCFDSRIVGVVSHILVVYVCTITLFGVFGYTSMGLDLEVVFIRVHVVITCRVATVRS